MLTQARLKELLRYDPETGIFTWLVKRGKRTDLKGKRAGSLSHGYIDIRIDDELHKAHRLAWLYMTGAWPAVEIDHEDRCRSNNRWRNLRAATHIQNMGNQSLRPYNRSGVIGVCWCAQTQRWRAHITIGGKMRHLGRFDDMQAAIEARNAAAIEVFGEFARVA